MNKKKLILIFSILLILVIAIIINYFNYKSFYVTFCDKNYNCNIKYEKKIKFKNILKKYNYKILKVDEVINYIDNDNIEDIIENSRKNEFPYGIYINDKIFLLSEEVNLNNIVDYANSQLNFRNLKKYLSKRKLNVGKIDEENIKLFKVKSYYIKNRKITKLKNIKGFAKRIYSDKEINSVIHNSSNKLKNMITENGKFIYGYHAVTGEELKSYNILRHSGSIYSLIKYYEYSKDNRLKEEIKRAINYVLDTAIIDKDDNNSLVYEQKSKEIKLGGSALFLLALSEYQLAYNDDCYYNRAKKLANAIINVMQKENGSFNHVLYRNYKLKDEYRIVYYDGEAVYALLKFYQISKDKKYLKSSQKALDYFISNNYIRYHDQWLSYAFNSFIKYNKENKYIEFLFDNYTKNNFDDINDFKPTRFELLVVTLDSYNYLKKHDKNNKYLKKFDIDRLNNSIEINKNTLLKYYVNEEMALYFSKPKRVMNGFMDSNANFRMRIDDVQHSVSGLMIYEQNKKR